MNLKLYRGMTGLLWLALPLTALQYWMVWDRLPATMATHFGAAGQANGWMSRETSLAFTLVVLVFMLSLFTWVVSRIRKPDLMAWSVLGMFYVVIAVMYGIGGAVLEYNLYGRPVDVVPAVVTVFVAVFVLIAVTFGSKRGAELPAHDVIAEEVHASPIWALACAVLTALELSVLAILPPTGIRLVVALPALLLFGVTALAWSGFHYRFTPHGVEITTLGFRLRSIPLQQIKGYAIERWSPLGGYGIRGVGECRAYVWGNNGVRIKTADGEVFLGHSEPGRIVRGLDAITGTHKAREGA